MIYQPHDILPPDKTPEVLPGVPSGYSETLGKREAERVAEFIVKNSQMKGRWTPIDSLDCILEDRQLAINIRDRMIKHGFLEKADSGFMLTEKAIESIAKKYPAITA